MRFAKVGSIQNCPQCGECLDRSEYCRRCGSPVSYFRELDPFKMTVLKHPLRVNAQAKWILRAGVLGLGMLCLVCGLVLSYGGWIDSESLDGIQTWASRISGLALLVQGVFCCRIPFNRPVRTMPAKVISLQEYKVNHKDLRLGADSSK